jgi:soluble lytic murein transglycosylase
VALVLLAALALGAALGLWSAAPPDLSRWSAPIEAAAAEFGVDPALLSALVAAESGGRPDAVSRAGARGLLQLMPGTAREQAERLGMAGDEAAWTEPRANLRLGAAYLASLLRRFGGEEAFALAAYNAGPTPVLRWRERAPHLSALEVILEEGYEETRTHVLKVLAWRDAYRR